MKEVESDLWKAISDQGSNADYRRRALIAWIWVSSSLVKANLEIDAIVVRYNAAFEVAPGPEPLFRLADDHSGI